MTYNEKAVELIETAAMRLVDVQTTASQLLLDAGRSLTERYANPRARRVQASHLNRGCDDLQKILTDVRAHFAAALALLEEFEREGSDTE